MKTEFYIDRQFGHAIFLDVEDGIFIGCRHKGKMEDAITEKYKGKTISEVKEAFELAFKGSYVCVHSLEYTNLLQHHHAHTTRINSRNIMLSDFKCSDEMRDLLHEANKKERSEQYQVELKLRDTWNELKNTHGFVFYENKFGDLVGELKN